jgi:hypothetical protein
MRRKFLAVIAVGALPGCSVGLPYEYEEKGDAVLKTERTIYPEDVDTLKIVFDNDHYQYRLFGQVSEVSFYSKDVVRRVLNPVNMAAGTFFGAILFADPQIAADVVKRGVLGPEVGRKTDYDNPFKEVKKTIEREPAVFDASNAAFTVRATDGISTLDGSGFLGDGGQPPFNGADVMKQFSDQNGYRPAILRWSLKVAQDYVTPDSVTKDKARRIEWEREFAQPPAETPALRLNVDQTLARSIAASDAVTFLVRIGKDRSLEAGFASLPGLCSYKLEGMRSPTGEWLPYENWRYQIIARRLDDRQNVVALLVGHVPSASINSPTNPEGASLDRPLNDLCQAYGSIAPAQPATDIQELVDVAAGFAALDVQPF